MKFLDLKRCPPTNFPCILCKNCIGNLGFINNNNNNNNNNNIISLLVMGEIWALPIIFGIPITSIYVLSCLKTLPKVSITSGTIYVLTLCSVLITLARCIYLLTFSFCLFTILWSWGIGISINCHFLSSDIFTIISGLLCFLFCSGPNLYTPKDSSPCMSHRVW